MHIIYIYDYYCKLSIHSFPVPKRLLSQITAPALRQGVAKTGSPESGSSYMGMSCRADSRPLDNDVAFCHGIFH